MTPSKAAGNFDATSVRPITDLLVIMVHLATCTAVPALPSAGNAPNSHHRIATARIHTPVAITSQLHVNYASYSILIITALTVWWPASFKLRSTWSTTLLFIGAPIPNVVANTFSPRFFPWKIDVPLVLSSCGPYVLSHNVWHVIIYICVNLCFTRQSYALFGFC